MRTALCFALLLTSIIGHAYAAPKTATIQKEKVKDDVQCTKALSEKFWKSLKNDEEPSKKTIEDTHTCLVEEPSGKELVEKNNLVQDSKIPGKKIEVGNTEVIITKKPIVPIHPEFRANYVNNCKKSLQKVLNSEEISENTKKMAKRSCAWLEEPESNETPPKKKPTTKNEVVEKKPTSKSKKESEYEVPAYGPKPKSKK